MSWFSRKQDDAYFEARIAALNDELRLARLKLDFAAARLMALESEVDMSKKVLWCVLRTLGGPVRVPDTTFYAVGRGDFIDSTYDDMQRTRVYLARREGEPYAS